MMTAILFDTLEFAARLKAAGFTDEQTRVILDVQKLTSNQTLEQARHDYHLDDIATKRDLKELETALIFRIKETDSKIELLRAETKRDIAETHKLIAESKAELVRWVVGAGLLQTSLIIGALMKMAHMI